MAYTQTTLTDFTADIAAALSDTGNVYWSATEIQYAVKEALLLWGLLTSRWVEQGSFTSAVRTPFYELTTALPTLRARTYTYDTLVREIQYHLLEPANGSGGSGMTDQFTVSGILHELLEGRNNFVLNSGIPRYVTTVDLTTPPPAPVVVLPDSYTLLQRLAWLAPSGIITRLRSADPYQARAASPLYSLAPGAPVAYSQTGLPLNQLSLIPPPLASGQLHLIYAPSQSITTGLLALPDEFAHAVKWSALSGLLSTSGPRFDPVRARYAAERASQYSDLVTRKCVISVQVNGSPVPLFTIDDLDSALPYWQCTYGTPSQAAATFDILALYKVPASTAYTVSCDVVRTAPLPASGGEYIQVGREELPYLADYCRHLLSFKMSGSDFLSTLPLYDGFLSAAAKRNSLTAQKARYLTPLFGQPDKQEQQTPAA